METLAALAKKKNEEIQTDFDSRERRCFDLIKQQEKSHENLMKVRMERAVIKETLEFEEGHVASALSRKMGLER